MRMETLTVRMLLLLLGLLQIFHASVTGHPVDTDHPGSVLKLTLIEYPQDSASHIIHEDPSKNCNRTISGAVVTRSPETRTVTLSMPEISLDVMGKPLYCWFRFEGTGTQVVQVDVRDVRAGNYDENTKDCSQGYLRISDNESCSTDPQWLPPTTICGHYEQGQVRVKRITRSQSAFVEFRLEKARTTKGYEFDVTFVDKELMDDKLAYGDLQKIDGRIPNTKCDWLIPVDECFGFCRVVSPGWPGIYPPNTRCQYLFTDFDDSRVELRFGGRSFKGKFDMKNSENCTEDFVEVYDGMSTINPLIGRYCGHDGAHIISQESSILLIFQSGPGGPPWDYSGFNIQVTDRWKNHHEFGQRRKDSICDWRFESADSPAGDLHTPDHMLRGTTQCDFDFVGEYNERVQLQILISSLLRNCAEYIEVYDGDYLVDTICRDDIHRPRQNFYYNTTGPNGRIRYVNTAGQTSKPEPDWMYYTFWKDPHVRPPTPPQEYDDHAEDLLPESVPVEHTQSVVHGNSSATAHSTRHHVTYYVIVAMVTHAAHRVFRA